MAKKRKRGRKSKASRKSSPVKQESTIVYEKRENIFSSIYNLSIGRIRVVALCLVLVGLVLICIGGVSLLNAIKTQIDNQNEETVGDINDGIQTDDTDESKDEDESVSGDQDEKDPSVKTQEVSENAESARTASQTKSERIGKWVATNYKSGDIKSGLYEVEKGDTLWEIAEAVYGSGLEWHKILDANSSTIGFLSNGSQALIIPGQVLTIP